MSPKKIVDVAVSLYGKPHQSAITLLSLLKHSGKWIDTLYITIEKKQPEGTDFSLLYKLLKPYNIVYQHPAYHIDYFDLTTSRRRYFLHYRPYRQSIRYQYAWEKTNKQYLLVSHNDVLYTGDIVGAYLTHLGDAIGIGKVGQCWNCPANKARLCSGDKYWNYRPPFSEVKQLYERYGNPRSTPIERIVSVEQPWPWPECRLNEYVALINLAIAKPITMPNGSIYPYGVWGPIDINTAWFREINMRGYKVANFDFDPYAHHAWITGTNNGHQALSNRELYEAEETHAYRQLCSEFGIDNTKNA